MRILTETGEIFVRISSFVWKFIRKFSLSNSQNSHFCLGIPRKLLSFLLGLRFTGADAWLGSSSTYEEEQYYSAAAKRRRAATQQPPAVRRRAALLYQSSTTNTTLFCRRTKNALDAHVDHSHHHKSNFLLTLPAGRVLKAIDSPRNVNAAGAFLPHGPLCDVKATDSPSNLSAAALHCLRRSDDTLCTHWLHRCVLLQPVLLCVHRLLKSCSGVNREKRMANTCSLRPPGLAVVWLALHG